MSDENRTADIHKIPGGRIHLLGIGGSSMSGLALILQDRGYVVSGSQVGDSEYIQRLRAAGIEVLSGNRLPQGEDVDLVVYTQAIAEDHPDLLAIKKKGIPVIPRSTLLGQLSEDYRRSISVCGTHGKTTVTSMLGQILIEAGTDPTVHIGGVLPAMGGSVRTGKSGLFLTEACEYKRAFLTLHASDILLLNIDTDHLDYYRDMDDIESAFDSFLQKLPADGWALGNGGDERVVRLLQKSGRSHSTYGSSEGCDYRIKNAVEDPRGYYSFDFYFRENLQGHVSMAVPGFFNAENAAAALAAAHHLGIDMEAACGSIGRFTGAHRRFELTGTLHGAELFHDYGHNPAEMRNAVSIARKRCRTGRLWAVVQPHTFSRVRGLFQDYLTCTEEADLTLVTDINGARETDDGRVNSKMLVEGMKEHGLRAVWTPTFQDAAALLRKNVRRGDLVITMGCGNIYRLNAMLEE